MSRAIDISSIIGFINTVVSRVDYEAERSPCDTTRSNVKSRGGSDDEDDSRRDYRETEASRAFGKLGELLLKSIIGRNETESEKERRRKERRRWKLGLANLRTYDRRA